MIKKVISNYCLVEAASSETLSKRVWEYLDVGWDLYGNPAIAKDADGFTTYVQAVVK